VMMGVGSTVLADCITVCTVIMHIKRLTAAQLSLFCLLVFIRAGRYGSGEAEGPIR